MSSLFSAIPFLGLLFSIAFLPLWAPRFWARHYGSVSLFWSLSTLLFACYGCHDWVRVCAQNLMIPLVEGFLPFALLLSALYVVTGGIVIHVGFRGRPLTNTVFLGIFSLLASVLGTTGAAMLGIRPLLEMNKGRAFKTHTVLFFIFLVCNIGGVLSAIGDPPLFLGFLKGIPFFWPTLHLWQPFLLFNGILLALYAGVDAFYLRREPNTKKHPDVTPVQKAPLRWLVVKGKPQLFLAMGILLSLILTARLDWGTVVWGRLHLPFSDMLRDGFLVFLMGVSFYLKPLSARARDKWHLHPLKEIILLFCGIFITAEPLLELLKQGANGPLGAWMSLLAEGAPYQAFSYFWVTGILSSFLDNAPTYLIFFSLAGGDPRLFLGPLQTILIAISAGAVFMGALTYIGNAPNLLVKAIAEEEYRVPMPSFTGYILVASCVLLPLLGVWSWWTFCL